jgi:acetyl-CoA acetyltransferase
MGAARKRPRSRSQRNHDNAVAGGAGANPRIERLRRDFARFRRTHPLRTRIPDSLRNAALAALQDGATESEVRRACGVTSDQIAQWAASQQARAPRTRRHQVEPRVFPVVEDATDLRHGSEAESQELELRLGSWSISVRQLQR